MNILYYLPSSDSALDPSKDLFLFIISGDWISLLEDIDQFYFYSFKNKESERKKKKMGKSLKNSLRTFILRLFKNIIF